MRIVLTAAFVLTCGMSSNAIAQQACGVPQSQTYDCSNTQGGVYCGQSITVTKYRFQDGGYVAAAGYVSCCGFNYLSYYSTGATCYYADLKDPKKRLLLQEASEHHKLLVAGCSGRYEPYTAETAHSTPGAAQAEPSIFLDGLIHLGQ